ncbi:MAG: hypothetical protein NVSMB23_28390 [Myxococcales bacterium]
MADFLGIPARRIPIAIALIIVLAFTLSWLQGRFDQTDVKKAISLALSQRPAHDGRSVFEALIARGEGDPRCGGKVLSQLLGDVEVHCETPGAPAVEYRFRVLLDGKRPPRGSNPEADALLATLARDKPGVPGVREPPPADAGPDGAPPSADAPDAGPATR